MTVGEINELFLKTCGNSQDAAIEAWLHLNFAHRKICAMLELPELHVPDATVLTVANQDYVDSDADLYSIDWIVDSSTGRKMDPEPGGMRGRARYIETGEVRPPTGALQFYQRKGNRIYLRDVPSSAVKLLISYRFHPPQLDDDERSNHLVTPHQYDMATVKMAASNFFELHPPILPDQSLDSLRARNLKESAMSDLGEQRSPDGEENLDRRQWTRQQGYQFSVWGR